MTHAHELRWGECWRVGGIGQREIKGRKKWDNCNSIINEIYLKMEREPTVWENIFANDASEKGLVSKIYKELI